jgi:hypothetical protein
LEAHQPAKKKLKSQGWYGRMTEEQRAEYLLKQRERRQRKQFADESIQNAQASLTLEPQGTMNVFTTSHNDIHKSVVISSPGLHIALHIY